MVRSMAQARVRVSITISFRAMVMFRVWVFLG
jgi:hypothetical protein